MDTEDDYGDEDNFSFTAIRANQLADVLDANPTRRLELRTGIWNEEQSVVLATRPYPIHLIMSDDSREKGSGFCFTDEGTAFVRALGKRQSSFGSLEMAWNKYRHIRRSNLKRLLKLDVFEKLKLDSIHKKHVLLPFSAKLTALNYTIEAAYVKPEDFDSLTIVARDLCLKICLRSDDEAEGRHAILMACLNRLAELGHFERLTISLRDCREFYEWEREIEDEFETERMIAQAWVAAIRGNPKLAFLNISHADFRSASDFDAIFRAMEEHAGLRTVIVGGYPLEKDDDSFENSYRDGDYSSLERLLSRNRKITVLSCFGERITNGTTIDELYLLNRFLNGSASLTKEPASLRPLLVASALIKSALKNFQRSALLMAHHADLLFEFIQEANIDNLAMTGQVMDDTIPLRQTESSSKRKVENQPSLPVAKKVTRDEA